MERRGLHITDTDRRLLTVWINAGKTPQRVARRARVVLQLADGRSARAVATRLGISTRSVALWKRRFLTGGPGVLLRDAPGRGRKASVAALARVRVRALLAMPPPTRRWTIRALAAAAGISRASAHRVLRADKLAPGAETAGRRAGAL